MATKKIDWAALAAPFPAEDVQWRVGATAKNGTSGLALAYIDTRAVMDRLDAVIGQENWACRYTDVGEYTCCEIGIRCGEEWVWKGDGAGPTDYEGVKGAFSDALKRAAVRWGIGRYLYHLDAPWVTIEKRGKSYVIKPSEVEKLKKLLNGEGSHRLGQSQATTEMRDNLRAFAYALNDVDTTQGLDELLDEYRETIQDMQHDEPGWWDGEETADFVPLKRRIEAKRSFLEGQGK